MNSSSSSSTLKATEPLVQVERACVIVLMIDPLLSFVSEWMK